MYTAAITNSYIYITEKWSQWTENRNTERAEGIIEEVAGKKHQRKR